MKLRFNPVIFVLLLIFAVCVFLLLFHFLKEPITVEGKWYCEKLGLQISLDEDSFVISNDGNEIACNAYSLYGSQRIVVYCLEEDCDQWVHTAVSSGSWCGGQRQQCGDSGSGLR